MSIIKRVEVSFRHRTDREVGLIRRVGERRHSECVRVSPSGVDSRADFGHVSGKRRVFMYEEDSILAGKDLIGLRVEVDYEDKRVVEEVDATLVVKPIEIRSPSAIQMMLGRDRVQTSVDALSLVLSKETMSSVEQALHTVQDNMNAKITKHFAEPWDKEHTTVESHYSKFHLPGVYSSEGQLAVGSQSSPIYLSIYVDTFVKYESISPEERTVSVLSMVVLTPTLEIIESNSDFNVSSDEICRSYNDKKMTRVIVGEK